MSKSAPDATDTANTAFLDACQQKPVNRIPVWYMRQAGRCLPEYRKLKEKYDILTLCRTPELAAEVSLMPIKRFGVDATILFADIMLPLIGMGVDLKIVETIGPVIAHPIRTKKDLAGLRTLRAGDEAAFDYLKKTIETLRKEPSPLIGFSGAPFTLASYLIEGKPSRTFTETKKLMYDEPELWSDLMRTLTDSIIFYLKLQINAGAQAVQLFDSWVGCLSKDDYIKYVLPYSREIFAALKSAKGTPQATQVPRIHFGTGNSAFLAEFASVDCEVIGVDWRIPLHEAWVIINEGSKTAGSKKAIQGNLDPAILICDWSVVKKKVDEIFEGLDRAGLDKKKGFIFNLGHGVLPETPAETLVKLTEYVHSK